ncbi:hypothetical protein ACJMK2_009923 [Sinanodonta woodiana]|uniref:T-cell immunomodulatory protein TIP C2 domain-containing protein n=1 Tax=Sinanodonta woodiana TaxID=1069815 RepID=A0ABD3VEZ7_SINWO
MAQLRYICILQTFILVICLPKLYLALDDVTKTVLQGENNGIIAAFGDFNADKLTDIFVIRENGTVLTLLLATQEKFSQETFKSVHLYTSEDNKTFITSVVPADFDGDSRMDVLVTRKMVDQNKANNMTNVTIFWGIAGGLGSPFFLPDLLVDQPLVLDADGDMIPDLLGEKEAGSRFYFMFRNRNFTEVVVKNESMDTLTPLKQPMNGAFVDLNNDLTADFCVMTMINGTPHLEIWLNEERLTWKQTIPVTGMKVVGQLMIADINGDQSADILLPACLDSECQKSDIFVLVGDKWEPMNIGLDKEGLSWSFIQPDQTPVSSHLYIPSTLRVGDFNLDGFPDLLTVVGNATRSIQRGLILYNVGCNSCPLGRTFSADLSTYLEGHEEITLLPAFFDVYEDGILDVVVSSVIPSNVPFIRVWKHKFDDDASFIKVMVVSGLCSYDCPGGNQPYGVNQMGPVIRFSTTGADGNTQTGAATQMSQSAYMALQLPYTLFGLGQTPNFVDSLDVGVPHPANGKPRHRTWTSIIPNSQLIVIPYPLDEPNSWSNRLFVTPSRLMLLTGAALLGTCGFIAGIVGILHWRDKVEDKKEKRQEAHRFHFDAM